MPQQSNFLRLLLCLVGVSFFSGCLSGCFGRIDDAKSVARSGSAVAVALGLDAAKPSLVVFGSTWCKPCRKEISDFNRIAELFKKNLDVVGVLVEGSAKGSVPTAEGMRQFLSPAGEKPLYSLQLDPGWALFDTLNPSEGHSLPLVALVRADGSVARVIQGSLDFESELKPLVEQFIAGQVSPQEGSKVVGEKNQGEKPEDTPATPGLSVPTKPGTSPSSFLVKDWVAQEAVKNDPVLVANFNAAWLQGLRQFGFFPSEMPFESGTISLKQSDTGKIPSFGEWDSASNCTLTVTLNPDASYKSARGICR